MRPLRFVRALSTPKNEATPNEDRWHVSDDALTCAVSDGASVSYDSAPWAERLTRTFVADPNPTTEWLADAAQSYSVEYDRGSMEWMQEAAFDKGSFASLLGVVIDPRSGAVRAFAIGDSVLVVVDRKSQVCRTLPYTDAEQFNHSPQLLSTSATENAVFDDAAIDAAWYDVAIPDQRSTILLMTDALGHWLMSEPTPERVDALLRQQRLEEFAEFVALERESGRMRRDDTTLLVIGRPT